MTILRCWRCRSGAWFGKGCVMGKFPYIKKFRIYTLKTPEEVRALMQGETAVWGIAHFPLGDGAYVGEVGESGFKVVPRPSWVHRTYSMAVMEGRIRTEGGETVVDVKMRFPWQIYLLFPAYFLLGMGFLIAEGPFPPVIYKVVFLFICGAELLFWIHARFGFYSASRGVEENLEELLEGEAEEWRRDDN